VIITIEPEKISSMGGGGGRRPAPAS